MSTRRELLKTLGVALPTLKVNPFISSDSSPSDLNLNSPKIGELNEINNNILQRFMGYYYYEGSFVRIETKIEKDKYKNKVGTSKLFHQYFTDLHTDTYLKQKVTEMFPETPTLMDIAEVVQREEYRKEYKDDRNQIVYTRHPIETIVEGRGDCVDKTLLLYSILGNLGYNVGYANMPNHVGVLVQKTDVINNVEDEDKYTDDWITVNGTEYGYIEAASENDTVNDPGEEKERLMDDIFFAYTVNDGFEVMNPDSLIEHFKGLGEIFIDRAA